MSIMRVLLFVAVAFVASAVWAGNDLVKYVPTDASMVLRADTKKLMALPAVKKAIDDPNNKEMSEVKKTIGKYGLRINDLADSALLFLTPNKTKMQPDAGLLVETRVTQSDAKKLIQEAMEKQKNAKATMVSEKIAGKEVFVFKGNEGQLISSGPMSMNGDGAMTYLAPNVALITSKVKMGDYLNSLKKTVSTTPKLLAIKTSVKGKGLVWGRVNVEDFKSLAGSPPPGPNGMQQPNPMEQIKTCSFSVNMGGQKKEDLIMLFDFDCVDDQASHDLSTKMQQAILLIAAFFQQDPQLGLELGQSIKINQNGKNILINIDLKKHVLDKLYAMMNQQAAAMGGAPGMPAPDTEPPPAPAPKEVKEKK